MRHSAPLRHVHPIMVGDRLRLGIRERNVLRNKIQAAQRKPYSNNLRINCIRSINSTNFTGNFVKPTACLSIWKLRIKAELWSTSRLI